MVNLSLNELKLIAKFRVIKVYEGVLLMHHQNH